MYSSLPPVEFDVLMMGLGALLASFAALAGIRGLHIAAISVAVILLALITVWGR